MRLMLGFRVRLVFKYGAGLDDAEGAAELMTRLRRGIFRNDVMMLMTF
jgi:hypothetical protein